MDVRTGKIHKGNFTELEKKLNGVNEMKNLVAVSEEQMTEKQKKEMKDLRNNN